MLNPWSLDEAIEYWRKRTKTLEKNGDPTTGISEQHMDWLEELKEFRAENRKSKDTRPLTPYELMGMDGQEVWVKTLTYPREIVRCFVDSTNMNMLENRESGIGYVLSFAPQSGRYWNEWVAYRNKPGDCDGREDH